MRSSLSAALILVVTTAYTDPRHFDAIYRSVSRDDD